MLTLLATFILAAQSHRLLHGRGGGRGNQCADMEDADFTNLLSSFTTGTTTLYCKLGADNDFPHFTNGCPDPTTTTTTTTTSPPVSTTTPTPVETVLLSADGGQRRNLGGRRGGRRGRERTRFQVTAGVFSSFMNKGGCRDESSFTCFDDLPTTDCAYTSITSSVNADVPEEITLVFANADSSETVTLVCPFEGYLKGSDCDEQVIKCRHQEYTYGDDTMDFSLKCSTEEQTWGRHDSDYPECPAALQ